jgi:hypothetical protein
MGHIACTHGPTRHNHPLCSPYAPAALAPAAAEPSVLQSTAAGCPADSPEGDYTRWRGHPTCCTHTLNAHQALAVCFRDDNIDPLHCLLLLWMLCMLCVAHLNTIASSIPGSPQASLPHSLSAPALLPGRLLQEAAATPTAGEGTCSTEKTEQWCGDAWVCVKRTWCGPLGHSGSLRGASRRTSQKI